jgi:hypothetical protein
MTDIDLQEHLKSKSHKLKLRAYWRSHPSELKLMLAKAKSKVARKYLFNTVKLQKITSMATHFKLMKQITI